MVEWGINAQGKIFISALPDFLGSDITKKIFIIRPESQLKKSKRNGFDIDICSNLFGVFVLSGGSHRELGDLVPVHFQ